MPNYNPKTGTPYGVISMQSIDDDVAHELWYTHGEDISYEEAFEELRAEIAATMRDDEENGECPIRSVDDFNDELDERVDRASDDIHIEEPTIVGVYEDVNYMISWLGGAPLLWIFQSPYVRFSGRCSPCVPGAGDLDSEGSYACYDVPPEWRRA